MSRGKGIPNRYHPTAFKIRLAKEVVDGRSPAVVGRENDVNPGLVRKWVRLYMEGGEAALEHKRGMGNPLAGYARRKELSEVERLRYELAKAEVEIAKLKKVYEDERRCGRQKK